MRRALHLGGALITAVLFCLPPPGGGLWNRRYLANLPMPTRAAWAGQDDPTAEPRAASPREQAGVGAYLGTYVPEREIDAALDVLSTARYRWVRTEIPWAGVEPTPGRWTWQPWDRAVAGLHARDFHIIGLLAYWAEGAQDYSDAALARFERYAEAVSRRYRGRIQCWEVWNEPNEPTYWKSTPARYVDLLKAAYRGVRKGDPGALVLGGSVSGADVHFLRKILDLGAGEHMDAVSLHPYSFGWTPESAELLHELRGVSRLLTDRGLPAQLWITEVGLVSGDDQKAADLLERFAVLLAQSGVVRTWTWHCLYYPTPLGYVLYRPDWSPRAGAGRLDSLLQRLARARPMGRAFPSDLRSPWGAGTPFAHTGLESWRFQDGPNHYRLSWVAGGSTVAEPLGGALLSRRIHWESAEAQP